MVLVQCRSGSGSGSTVTDLMDVGEVEVLVQ